MALTQVPSGMILAGAIGSTQLASAAVGPTNMSGAQSGSAPVYGARAWVNFNGIGTIAIRASGNVSSITDIGTGQYRVNFTTAMADANYSVTYMVSSENVNAGGRSGNVMMINSDTVPTASGVTMYNLYGASSSTVSGYGDVLYACVTIFD